MAVPRSGAVLGVDVGYSVKRRSSAICRLEWDENQIRWEFRRFRCEAKERRRAIAEIAGEREFLAAAFDGSFCADLENAIGEYRCAERILTCGIGRIIGKPGPSNSPVGRNLNCATNQDRQRNLGSRTTRSGPPPARRLNGSRQGKSDRYFEELNRTDVFKSPLNRLFRAACPKEGWRK